MHHLGTYHVFSGARLALSRFFLSTLLVSMIPHIRRLATKCTTLLSRHTSPAFPFSRCHTILSRHPATIFASSLSASHPQMVNPRFQACTK
ncbi:hypothetical protein EV363DRAFT_1377972, partial [Boletus edulis]